MHDFNKTVNLCEVVCKRAGSEATSPGARTNNIYFQLYFIGILDIAKESRNNINK
jgi:hypothetical protein